MVRPLNRTPLPLKDDSIPYRQVIELRGGHPVGVQTHPHRHSTATFTLNGAGFDDGINIERPPDILPDTTPRVRAAGCRVRRRGRGRAAAGDPDPAKVVRLHG